MQQEVSRLHDEQAGTVSTSQAPVTVAAENCSTARSAISTNGSCWCGSIVYPYAILRIIAPASLHRPDCQFPSMLCSPPVSSVGMRPKMERLTYFRMWSRRREGSLRTRSRKRCTSTSCRWSKRELLVLVPIIAWNGLRKARKWAP